MEARTRGRLWAAAAVMPWRRPGVWGMHCADPRCPDVGPLPDAGQARKTVLEHLAAHHEQAGPVVQPLFCRCRGEEHRWHTGTVRCQGAGVRLMTCDRARLAWRLAEVYVPCARMVPGARIVTTPSAPSATEATTPSPRTHSADTAPPAPSATAGPTTAIAWLGTDCGQPAVTARLLTAPQGAAARRLLRYTAGLPLSGADAKLLAVVLAIRAARDGQANVTGQDLRSLRLTDPAAALAQLADLGWRPGGDLLRLDPFEPVQVTVPGLGQGGALPFGRGVRTRVSGWTARTLAAKPLRKQPPRVRHAALYAAAHAAPDGTGNLALIPGEYAEAAAELLTAGFLIHHHDQDYRIDPVLLHLVPPG